MAIIVLEFVLCLFLGSMTVKAHRFGLQRRADITTSITNPVKVAAPLRANISEWFEGNDGPWSTFLFTAASGNQGQSVRLLPSTSLPEAYLVGATGCDIDQARGKLFDYDRPCDQSRGGLYNSNASTNYIPMNKYKPGQYQTFRNFNQSGFIADLGFEELRFGSLSGGNIGMTHMNVFSFWDLYPSWLGLLGIDPRPSHFMGTGGFKTPQPNLVQVLKDSGQIPSESWSYTAGSRWREAGIPGSLVFGGYDLLRFEKNNVNFTMNSDEETRLKVALLNIELKTSNTTTTLPLNKQANGQNSLWSMIDSTRPYLYLPQSVCDTIATNLNLKWDSATQHYLIPSYPDFASLNASLTFRIAPKSNSPSTVVITLPYTSLGLQLRFPYFEPTNQATWYFPMRPALTDDQHTLGRAFLQDAYLIADYGRNSFSVHPVIDQTSNSNTLIKPIYPPNNSTGTFDLVNKAVTKDSSSTTANHMTTGTIAGIVAGVISGVVIVAGLIIFFCLRRRRVKARKDEEARLKREAEEAALAAKIEGQSDTSQSSTQMTSSTNPSPSDTLNTALFEADSNVVHESGGELVKPPEPVVELPDSASNMSGFYWKDGEMLHEMQGSDVPAMAAPETWRSGDLTMYGPRGSPPPQGADQSSPPGYTLQALTVPGASGRSGSPPPASPIPQTPLEFYGPVRVWGPGGPTRVRADSGARGWVGRAPGVPDVTLTPATPATPVVPQVSLRQMIEPVNERRPPIEENKWPADEKKQPI